MTRSNDTAPTAGSWGLDPICWCFVKLCNIHLHEHVNKNANDTEEAVASTRQPVIPGGFYLFQRPITKVELVGYIISKAIRNQRIEYVLDDGTALVQVVQWIQDDHQEPETAPILALGTLVRVQGKLKHIHAFYQHQVSTLGSIEVFVTRICPLTDPLMECLHWHMTAQCFDRVYSQGEYFRQLQLDWESNKRATLSSESLVSKMFEHACFLDQEGFAQARAQFRLMLLREEHELKQREGAFLSAMISILFDAQLKATSEQYVFSFSSLLKCRRLRERLVRPLDSDRHYVQLFRKTFLVLRHHGIIVLMDSQLDTFGYTSHVHVLEPCLNSLLSSDDSSKPPLTLLSILADRFFEHQKSFHRIPLAWIQKSIETSKSNLMQSREFPKSRTIQPTNE